MRVSKLFAAVAAASLVATPVLAQGSASKLSVASGARISGTAGGASALQDETMDGEGTGAGGVVIAVAAAVAVGLGIYLIADGGDDDDDLPTSP